MILYFLNIYIINQKVSECNSNEQTQHRDHRQEPRDGTQHVLALRCKGVGVLRHRTDLLEWEPQVDWSLPQHRARARRSGVPRVLRVAVGNRTHRRVAPPKAQFEQLVMTIRRLSQTVPGKIMLFSQVVNLCIDRDSCRYRIYNL